MTPNNKKSENTLSTQLLEAQLRAFPRPATPPELEQKLLAGIPPAQQIVKPRSPVAWRWVAAGTAVAVVVVLIVILMIPQKSVRTPRTQAPAITYMSKEDIEQTIEREAIASQLLASANILADYPAGQRDAAEIQQYITRTYADTSAAKQILKSTFFKSGDTP